MRKINLLFLTAALVVCSFAQEPSVGIPAGGGLNLPATARSKPTPRGTSLPGTCEVGETYFKTDAAAGQNLYGCTSTNTWTLLGDGGGAGGGDNISINGTAASDADFDDSTPTAPANSINARWQKDGLTPNNVSANVPYASPLTVSGGNLTVASDSLAATHIDETANFSFTGTLFGTGALTCGAGTAGKTLVHTTPLQYCDNAATPALQYAAFGDSSGNALSGDSATSFFSSGTVEAARLPNLENLNGALDLASGGTNQATWTASRCVRVNDAGTALDVAAADCGSGGGNHNLLSATHPDTTAASPTRGDIVTAQGASPTWSRLAKGTQYQVLNAGSTEPAWGAVALDQSTAVTGILGSANGGTGNGFTKFTGPTTAEKTFTLPNASATILTTNAAVTAAQGGTGQSTTATTGRFLKGDGTNWGTSTGSASGTGACGANSWASTLNSDAAPTCTQPDFSNLTGTVGDTQIADGAVDGGTGGEIADGSITSADLATANKTITKTINIFDPTTGDTNLVQIYWPAAVTLQRVACSIDTGTSVTIQFDERAEATPNSAGTDSLTAALVCDTDSQVTTSFSDAVIAADLPHNLQITGAVGTPGVLRIHVKAQVN